MRIGRHGDPKPEAAWVDSPDVQMPEVPQHGRAHAHVESSELSRRKRGPCNEIPCNPFERDRIVLGRVETILAGGREQLNGGSRVRAGMSGRVEPQWRVFPGGIQTAQGGTLFGRCR